MLCRFADQLEASSEDLSTAIRKVVQTSYEQHKRIIFNGDGYAKEWIDEAERRGLLNLPTTADTLPCYLNQKNIALFERHKIFTAAELRLPSVMEYTRFLSETISAKKAAIASIDTSCEEDLLIQLQDIYVRAYHKTKKLSDAMEESGKEDKQQEAYYFKEVVLPLMEDLRVDCDLLETFVAKEFWKFPTYGDILYYK